MFRINKEIVDYYAHGDAPVRCAHQTLSRECTNVVRAPDELLHIDRCRSVFSQPGSTEQRLFTLFQDVSASLRSHPFTAVRTILHNPFLDRLCNGKCRRETQ